jgi:hypothetical protein
MATFILTIATFMSAATFSSVYGIVTLTHDLRTAAQFVAVAAAPDRNPLGVGQTVFRQRDNARAMIPTGRQPHLSAI